MAYLGTLPSRTEKRIHWLTPSRNYHVTAKGASSRTKAVACMEYMDRKSWMSYVAGKSQKGFNASKTADIICRWIEIYLCESNDSIGGIKSAIEKGPGLDPAIADSRMISTALNRWDQIMQLCNDARDAVSSKTGTGPSDR